ncbi:MAG: AAA family ATPase [Candidatus Adiutrix intracellularis]|nr:AAA family ATPase [Candidatus Adiutrix intracellularis]
MAKALSSFYLVLKVMDEYLHFIFLTGITKIYNTFIFQV